MEIENIKKLRQETGLGIAECKSALEKAKGDLEKALKILSLEKKKIFQKKQGKEVKEGVISAYVHSNQKIGVLVELLCQTDFVAHSDKFQNLAYEIALQVAASNPQWISKDEVPDEVVKEEKKILKESLPADKPNNIKEKIVQGKLEEFFKENCLLEQVYIRDQKLTINDLIQDHVAFFKENIKISRFVRFSL